MGLYPGGGFKSGILRYWIRDLRGLFPERSSHFIQCIFIEYSPNSSPLQPQPPPLPRVLLITLHNVYIRPVKCVGCPKVDDEETEQTQQHGARQEKRQSFEL